MTGRDSGEGPDAPGTCPVRTAREAVEAIRAGSAGCCVFCREGTRQLVEVLGDIARGRGRTGDVDLLVRLGEGMRLGASCETGRTAPGPVLAAIRDYRSELEAHVNERRCPAGVCEELPGGRYPPSFVR